MKLILSLFLITFASFTSSSAHAQSLQTAFTQGTVAPILWHKDLIEAVNVPAPAFLLINYDNEGAAPDTMKAFDAIAKKYAGVVLFVKINNDEATKAGSQLGAKTRLADQFQEPVRLIFFAQGVALSAAGIPAQTTQAQIEAVISELVKNATKVVSDLTAQARSRSDEASTPVTPPTGVSKALSTASLKNYNFSNVFDLEKDADFNELAADSKNIPVVVDFNATWCGPCRQLAPVLREAAARFKGKVRFVSIDVDMHRTLSSRLKTEGFIPEMRVYRNGDQSSVEIQAQFDVESMVQVISRATGIKP